MSNRFFFNPPRPWTHGSDLRPCFGRLTYGFGQSPSFPPPFSQNSFWDSSFWFFFGTKPHFLRTSLHGMRTLNDFLFFPFPPPSVPPEKHPTMGPTNHFFFFLWFYPTSPPPVTHPFFRDRWAFGAWLFLVDFRLLGGCFFADVFFVPPHFFLNRYCTGVDQIYFWFFAHFWSSASELTYFENAPSLFFTTFFITKRPAVVFQLFFFLFSQRNRVQETDSLVFPVFLLGDCVRFSGGSLFPFFIRFWPWFL